MGGIVGGAVSGAAAGSEIYPGWGTVIGAGAGALMGAMNNKSQSNQQGAVTGAGNTQANYASQAAAANQQYLNQGLGYLNNNYGNAQNALGQGLQSSLNSFSPYTLGSANALDLYETSLGMATPQGGNFALQQALNTNQSVNNLGRLYQMAVTADPNAAANNTNGLNNTFQSSAIWNNPQYAGDVGHTITSLATQIMQNGGPQNAAQQQFLNQYQSMGGSAGMTGSQFLNQNGMTSQSLTPQQQQLVNSYTNGTISQNSTATNPSGLYNLVTSNPEYQFALQQGLQAVQNQASAQGLAGSAPMAKQLQAYGSGLASQTFQNYQNQLASFAGMGAQYNPANLYQQTASNQANLFANQANAGANLYGQMGTNIGNSLLAQGAALSNAQINSANLGAAQSAGNMSMLGALGSNPNMLGNIGSSLGSLFGSGSSGGSAVTDWGATGGNMPQFDMSSFGL